MFDLGPATTELARLVRGLRDEQLDAPTPCPQWSVRDLLDHVQVFTTVFVANARKEDLPDVAQRPVSGRELPADWRVRLPGLLDELAEAWRQQSAWEGRVSAGGLEMSAEDNALVGLEESVVHGWDLARASGQEVVISDESLAGVERFLVAFAGPIASGQGPYGPAAVVPERAPYVDRVIARTGRDPGWSSPGTAG